MWSRNREMSMIKRTLRSLITSFWAQAAAENSQCYTWLMGRKKLNKERRSRKLDSRRARNENNKCQLRKGRNEFV